MVTTLARRIPVDGELIRYGVASALALAVDFGALVLCTEGAGVPYPLSAAGGFGLGVAVTYLLSIGWVFRGRRGEGGASEFAAFAAIGIAGLVLNLVVIWHLTEVAGLHYQLSKGGAAAVVFLFNFQCRRALLSGRRGLPAGIAR